MTSFDQRPTAGASTGAELKSSQGELDSQAAPRLAALLDRIGRGDDAALRLLHGLTRRKLRAVVGAIVDDADDCEDVLQEVYLTIWRKAADYRPGFASPISWLAAIARNRAIDRWRSRADHRRTSSLEAALNVPDPGRTPAESLEREEFSRQMAASINRLDARASAAVRMALIDGDTVREVALRFRVPVSTMKSIIRRALAAMRGGMVR